MEDMRCWQTRLVSTIEKHAVELTRRVVEELRTNDRTPSYHRLESQENYARVFNVVSNLGAWLDRKSDVVPRSHTARSAKGAFARAFRSAKSSTR